MKVRFYNAAPNRVHIRHRSSTSKVSASRPTEELSSILNCISSIEPEEYYLALSELEYGGTWRYNGLLQVDAVVSVAASEIVMNAKDLIIRDATLTQVGIVGGMFGLLAKWTTSEMYSAYPSDENFSHRRRGNSAIIIPRDISAGAFGLYNSVQWNYE